MISDPRPMEPSWVNEDPDCFPTDNCKWAQRWVTWNRDKKEYDRHEKVGSNMYDLLDAILAALESGLECGFEIDPTEMGEPVTLNTWQMYYAQHKYKDYTEMYWNAYDPAEAGDPDEWNCGRDNGELLCLVEECIHQRWPLIVSIGFDDPTP